jgi:uncharacterized protein (DUF488 family)
MRLLTVGHGALRRAELAELLTGARVEHVVDVRRFPGSRANPDVARDALATWLPAAGIAYTWEARLGGRRHLRTEDDAAAPDQWWRVAAFRAYAGYTRTPEFAAGLEAVLAGEDVVTALMCSESVWWRCHRRIIADVLVAGRGRTVAHLMPGGRLSEHVPSAGARRTADGSLVWDGEAPAG